MHSGKSICLNMHLDLQIIIKHGIGILPVSKSNILVREPCSLVCDYEKFTLDCFYLLLGIIKIYHKEEMLQFIVFESSKLFKGDFVQNLIIPEHLVHFLLHSNLFSNYNSKYLPPLQAVNSNYFYSNSAVSKFQWHFTVLKIRDEKTGG